MLDAVLKLETFIAAPNSDDWSEPWYLHIAAIESIANGRLPRRRRRV